METSSPKARLRLWPHVVLLPLALLGFAWLLNALADPPWVLGTVVERAGEGTWVVLSLGVAAFALVGQLLSLQMTAPAASATSSWQAQPVGDEYELRCPDCANVFRIGVGRVGEPVACPQCGCKGRVGRTN